MTWHYMEVSINGGTQKWMQFTRGNPIKVDDFGKPPHASRWFSPRNFWVHHAKACQTLVLTGIHSFQTSMLSWWEKDASNRAGDIPGFGASIQSNQIKSNQIKSNQSINLTINLSIYQSTNLSIYQSINLSISLKFIGKEIEIAMPSTIRCSWIIQLGIARWLKLSSTYLVFTTRRINFSDLMGFFIGIYSMNGINIMEFTPENTRKIGFHGILRNSSESQNGISGISR